MTFPRYDHPGEDEYPPYFARYISLVPKGDLLTTLGGQLEETLAVLRDVPEARGDHAYAPGKWTLKEVLVHVADAERVFGYRALRFARGDSTPLAPFDENVWAPNSGGGLRTLASVSDELRAVRAATLALLRNLPPEAPARRGVANNKEISVRALAWVIAGHELHHRRVLQERYLTP